MILQVILEGLGLGALLALVCAVGIRKGAVGMVHLYSPAVQQRCVKLGLTTHEKIKRNSQLFKAVCIPGYIGYVLALVRCAFPSVANDLSHDAPSPSVADSCEAQVADGKVANGVSSEKRLQ